MKRTLRQLGAVLASLCAVLAATPAQAGHTLFPGELKATVKRVHAAALNHDWSALRATMGHEFKLNFEAAASPEHAIEAWRHDPAQLQTLAEATKGACEWETRDSVTCPAGQDSTRYRATLSKAGGHWKLIGFVVNE